MIIGYSVAFWYVHLPSAGWVCDFGPIMWYSRISKLSRLIKFNYRFPLNLQTCTRPTLRVVPDSVRIRDSTLR